MTDSFEKTLEQLDKLLKRKQEEARKSVAAAGERMGIEFDLDGDLNHQLELVERAIAWADANPPETRNE